MGQKNEEGRRLNQVRCCENVRGYALCTPPVLQLESPFWLWNKVLLTEDGPNILLCLFVCFMTRLRCGVRTSYLVKRFFKKRTAQ